MSADLFRQDNGWRPPADGSYAFVERWGEKARLHFRIGGTSPERTTDWVSIERARTRAVEIAKLEGLALPLIERDEPST